MVRGRARAELEADFAGTTRIATKLEISPTGEGYGPGAKNLKEVAQYFYHQDHLGSTGFATDATGEVYQHLEYFPFGETWVDEVSDDTRVPYRFTGQEFDQETKLYYHGARYYDPKTSVWQNPDSALNSYLNATKTKFVAPYLDNAWRATLNGPGLGGAFEPKNLALASYGAQNPLKYIDPDGRQSEDPQKKFWEGIFGSSRQLNQQPPVEKRERELDPTLTPFAIQTVRLNGVTFASILGKHSPTSIRRPGRSFSIFDPVLIKDYETFVDKVLDPALAPGATPPLVTPSGRPGELFIERTLPYAVGTAESGAPTNTVRIVVRHDLGLSLTHFENI